jgi:hypothetical protein
MKLLIMPYDVIKEILLCYCCGILFKNNDISIEINQIN